MTSFVRSTALAFGCLVALSATATAGAGDRRRVSVTEVWQKLRDEFQLYRGRALERWSDRLAVGHSSFDPGLTVKKNLEALVKEHQLPHYYADIRGKQVLHVIVDLAQGEKTASSLRQAFRRVGSDTIELNYKAATPKSPYGHVAVRVGDGATYDLTGTRGTAELPQPLRLALAFVRGSEDLSFGRKRNLRRFMETRRAGPDISPSLFYGLLFRADAKELADTAARYESRLKQVTEFSVVGGDADRGVYSCAQFLTHAVPFFNQRGVPAAVSAKGITRAALESDALEAVIVYRTPRVSDEEVATSLP
jgi:hypothetical protein